MKHLLLLVALLVAPLAALAADSTAKFPNISVTANASVGTLTNTTGQAITTTGLTVPSIGILGTTTTGGAVDVITNSLNSVGSISDPTARLAFIPSYGLTSTYTWGGGYGAPTASSSTFAGWGIGVGVPTASFNTVQFAVYPFDTSSVPTTVKIRLRYVGADIWPKDVATNVATKVASWTILAQVTNTVSLTPLQNNVITASFGTDINTTSNLWIEVVSNGRIGMAATSPAISPSYTVIPPPAYVTASQTNWTGGTTSHLKQFSVYFGTDPTLNGFTISTYLSTLLGLTNAAVFSLPPTNYAVSGTEFNLYWRNVLRASKPVEDLWMDATCTTGTQYSDFFRTLPVDADAGTYALTITASDITNTLATYSGKLKIAADAAGSGVTRKLLVIGDSTTAGGQVVTELNRISGTNGFKLDTIGTQGSGTNKHEGWSGYTLNIFYTGAGYPSPFTNGAGAFNFNFYLTNNALTMAADDWVFVNLGINDVFSQTSDTGAAAVASTFLTTYSNMVVNIRATVPGIRCGLCVTIPPSYSQDPFGIDYGTGQTFRRYNRNRSILAESLAAYSQTGVYVVPIAAGLDTVNNMQTTTGVLNSRNTNSWTYLSNGVHPATIGYYQIADQMWAFLKCME